MYIVASCLSIVASWWIIWVIIHIILESFAHGPWIGVASWLYTVQRWSCGTSDQFYRDCSTVPGNHHGAGWIVAFLPTERFVANCRCCRASAAAPNDSTIWVRIATAMSSQRGGGFLELNCLLTLFRLAHPIPNLEDTTWWASKLGSRWLKRCSLQN